jgi:uncharacterized protein (DUF2252 family)
MEQVPDRYGSVAFPAAEAGGALPTRAQRAAAGKAARAVAPLEAHRAFAPAPSRDPVGLLLGQAASRVPNLVPVRHGRMLVSPFAFFRGAALPMAADLATTPTPGLRVQLCGDAHLANFGVYASPERRVVFDLNDFDETLPGPFEWDVKRLAASLVVAGRGNGYANEERRKIVLAAVAAYRAAMREFAAMPVLDVWYSRLDVEDALARDRSRLSRRGVKKADAFLTRVRSRDSLRELDKATTVVDGRRRIVSNPPVVVPIEEIYSEVDAGALYESMSKLLAKYRRTLQSNRRHLLDQFHLVHMARKVVGVGSVGTEAWVLLMQTGDGEPLFLQAKQAQLSVLAAYAGRSRYDNEGQRVVTGQHLMQAASDIFLGWQRSTGRDGRSIDHYVRQLRDWKYSATIEEMIPSGMLAYARRCAWTLARAHARSGDRIAIAAYLGKSDRFDLALADFAETYADQNERDYAALAAAAASGQVTAEHGI